MHPRSGIGTSEHPNVPSFRFLVLGNICQNRRKPKGDGGKGTGKKMSRQFATNVKPCGLESLGWGRAPPSQAWRAVAAPKCHPLREVSANSPSPRKASRQLPSPRGRHRLPSAEARVPLREVVWGQLSRYHSEVVLSQLLREDICQGQHQSRDFLMEWQTVNRKRIQSLNLPSPSAPGLPRGARGRERANPPRAKARAQKPPPGSAKAPTSSPRRNEQNQRPRK